jgi:hypothetical protein
MWTGARGDMAQSRTGVGMGTGSAVGRRDRSGQVGKGEGALPTQAGWVEVVGLAY